MHTLLQRVHLGGLITSAVLEVSDSECFVECIDDKQGLIVSLSADVELSDGDYGVDNIPKMLDIYSLGDVEASFKPTQAIFKIPIKGSKGTSKIPLVEPEEIPTKCDIGDDDDSISDHFEEAYEDAVEFTMDGELWESIRLALKVLANGYVVFSVNKNKVKLVHPKAQVNPYSLPLADTDSDESFRVCVNLEYLPAIAKTIDWEIDKLHFRLADEAPVHIAQGSSDWYLIPRVEE